LHEASISDVYINTDIKQGPHHTDDSQLVDLTDYSLDSRPPDQQFQF
jgi:hypothetical protein